MSKQTIHPCQRANPYIQSNRLWPKQQARVPLERQDETGLQNMPTKEQEKQKPAKNTKN